jgi:hypothetical protein
MITVILLICTNVSINGQMKPNAYSINPKIGAYNWIGENIGLVIGGEINLLYNKYIFSLDYYHCMEIMAIPLYNQINFLVGKETAGKYFRLQFQGGLGAFWGVKEGKWIDRTWFGYYETEKFLTFGVPIKLGFKTIPARFISIGIDLQANLNFEKPLYMSMVSIGFGKFRNK